MFLDEAGVTTISKLAKATFVAQEAGKGLSTNDFTDALRQKLENLTSLFRLVGVVATVQDLPATAENGDIYGVGNNQDGYTGYIWFGNQFHEWERIETNAVDYRSLVFKPSINGVELVGDTTTQELHLVDEVTFTTALNNKLDLPANIGQPNTVLICNADGTLEWGSIGGIGAGNQTINGTVTINVTASSGIACWILNRNNTTAGFIELKYSNTRTFVIGKGGSSSNTIYLQSFANYAIDINSNNQLHLRCTGTNSFINLWGNVVCTAQVQGQQAPTTPTSFIRKQDIKEKVASATSWDEFKTLMEAW